MAKLVDRALEFIWPLTRIYNTLKGHFQPTMVSKEEEFTQNTLKSPGLNLNRAADVKTPVSRDYLTIFDIDPHVEPKKPLKIDLNLDQLENFED